MQCLNYLFQFTLSILLMISFPENYTDIFKWLSFYTLDPELGDFVHPVGS